MHLIHMLNMICWLCVIMYISIMAVSCSCDATNRKGNSLHTVCTGPSVPPCLYNLPQQQV